MIGKSHYKIAEQIAAHIPSPWKQLLIDYWYAIEVGIEVPDQFMIWHRDPERPASAGKQKSKLVHRYYLDSCGNSRGEMLQMILMYTEGITAFAKDLAADKDLREQTQDMVLYTGALLHFLADLCTPLHVGCSLASQLKDLLGKNHHQKIEARLWRRQKKAPVKDLLILPACSLDEEWLLQQARDTHNDYLKLPASLVKENKELLVDISLRALYRSVSIGVTWLNAMAEDHSLKEALAEIANSEPNPR